MNDVPVFIVNRNLLTWPQRLVSQLRSWGMTDITIVDNDSTYEPLLEWYRSGDVRVVDLGENLGPRAVWLAGLNKTVDDLYIVTDPDIGLEGLGADVLDLLLKGLVQYPLIRKAGLGLKIPAASDSDLGGAFGRAMAIERMWRSCPLDDCFFSAAVDTSFALYSRSRDHMGFFQAVRTREPYEATHLPWTDAVDEIRDEYRYYVEHSTLSGSLTYQREEE